MPADDRPLPRLVTIAQAASDLCVSERTMRQLSLDGRIKIVRIGRCVRVPREELDRLVRDGVELPVEPAPATQRKGRKREKP